MELLPIIGYTPVSDVEVSTYSSERFLLLIAEWRPYGDCNVKCGGHPGGVVQVYLAHPNFETRPATIEQRGPGGEVTGLITYSTYSNGRLKLNWSQPYLVSENVFTTTPVGEDTCRPSFPTATLYQVDISDFVGVRTTIPPVTLGNCQTAYDLDGRYTPTIEFEGECPGWTWETGKYAVIVDNNCDEPFVPFIPAGQGVYLPNGITDLIPTPTTVATRYSQRVEELVETGEILYISPVYVVGPTLITLYVLQTQPEIFAFNVQQYVNYGVRETITRSFEIGEGNFRLVLFDFNILGQGYQAAVPVPADTGVTDIPYVELALIGAVIVAVVLILGSGGTATPIASVPIGAASASAQAAAASQAAAAAAAAEAAALANAATAAQAAAAAEAASILAQREAIRAALGIGSNGLRTASQTVVRQTTRGF